jgi:uncharacterized protein
MLYDNALLLRAYAHAATVTDLDLRDRFARRRRGHRDLPAARDAPPRRRLLLLHRRRQRGRRGEVLRLVRHGAREVVAATGEDPDAWARFFGVTPEGNWEGANILSEPVPRPEGDPDWTARFERVRAALRERREQRVHPGLDDKVLTSWNALAIGALAEAGALLGRADWVAEAGRTAGFLRRALVVDGALLHTWSEGHGASIPAFLEDVAFLAQALLSLHEASGDVAWLTWARELAADADTRFAEVVDSALTGAWFATAHDAEALPTRPKDLWDNAQPSGASVMADVHLRLHALTGEPHHAEAAEATLRRFAGRAVQAPTGYGELLRAAERALAGPVEVAVVADGAEEAAELVGVYRERWRPGAVLAVGTPGDGIPLLEGRDRVDGRATAYVCRHFACERPVTDPVALRAQLGSA